MESNKLWHFYLLLIFNILFRTGEACFVACNCKWKNGKQTVDCTDAKLPAIPDGMDPETQVLKFSGNNMSSLHNEMFFVKRIVNLQRVSLASCNIRTVHEDAFKGLANLVELDLSQNELTIVPSSSFVHCPSLMKLFLGGNRIGSVKRFAFDHLVYLATLDLGECEIAEVEEGAFAGLRSLEWLALNGNRLKTMRGRPLFPDGVKGVELQKNVWECDCHIQDLFGWVERAGAAVAVEPTCHGPVRLRGRGIKSIKAGELACLPDISPTAFYLELGEGKNVSFACHVHAVPNATVSWWFQGQLLQNNSLVAPGVHLIYYLEKYISDNNKRSELFIYNTTSSDNGTFVCTAENAAGTAQSNFTIKILLKEEPPVVIIVSFPFEYILFIIAGIAVLAIAILLVFAVLIWKCHRRRSRQKKLTLIQPTTNKSTEPPEPSTMETPQNTLKETQLQPLTTPYPIPVSYNPLEPNPDLIPNCRHEGDGIENEQIKFESSTAPPTISLTCLQSNFRCLLDPQGFPLDYGLPKPNYYQTLPSSRMKRHSAANPINRYSREAEFLSHSLDNPQPYDHFQVDVRYTADGYPVRLDSTSVPLPPPCVPANLHEGPVARRCASAQTEAAIATGKQEGALGAMPSSAPHDITNDTLTESPDEGYGGEPSVV